MTELNTSAPVGAPDPFTNLDSLRLNQSFADTVGVKRLLTTVPVRKPGRQDFVRVHPAEEYRLTPAALIELKEDRETYLVMPQVADELPGEFVFATLYTTISRQGVLSLWPVRLQADGRQNDWHRSAAEAAELAMRKWIRLSSNMALGAYEIFEATGNLGEPTWPDVSLADILRIAFRGHFVDSPDHPLVQRLLGAA